MNIADRFLYVIFKIIVAGLGGGAIGDFWDKAYIGAIIGVVAMTVLTVINKVRE